MEDATQSKRRIKKKVIWIVAGLILLLILAAISFYGYHKLSVIINQSQLRAAYEESLTLIPEEVPIPEEVYITEWDLARIIIPKIGVDLIVLGGVDIFDPVYLDQGPVYFGETIVQNPDYRGSLPNNVSGNVAIGGHRAGKWKFFYDIDLLEKGDEIILDINGYRFIYHVQWQKVTDKYDWSCTDPTDYPALTLQACEPKDHKDPNPDHRLFIRAELQEVTRTP
jgi:LPXTG-site transpeptidase (sortase) family protein